MQWNWKKLLICHLLILLLFATLILPWTHQIWRTVDTFVFHLLNDTLHLGTGYQTFWAFANHRHADWLEDGIILSFYTISIFKMPKPERLKRVAEFIFCLLFIALTIILINRLLYKDLLSLRRSSPALVIENCFRLSEALPWLEIKDVTTKSFPGDHATSALLFAITYAFFAGKKWGTAAIFYAIFLCLPRLIAGAHWLSDLVIGTGSILLLAFSWGFYTPLQSKASTLIEKALKKLKRAKPLSS